MEITLYPVGTPENDSFLIGLDTLGDVYRYPMTAFFAPTFQSLADTVLSATTAATTATNAANSVSDAIAAAISNLTGDLATDVSDAANSAAAASASAISAAGTLSTLEAGITAAVSSAVGTAVAPMLSTVSGLNSASTKGVGTSVNDPGSGNLETLLPIQTTAATSKTYYAVDLFKETRRSNSGTAMTDTFPGSSTTGLTNGTMMQINNVDTTASLTITAGAGTSMNGGNTTAIIGPGRSTKWVYDAANTTWRTTMNSISTTLLTNMQAYSTNTSTSASTSLTAANIYGGSVEHTLNLTGAISSASNAQLPTVAALITQMGNVLVGETYKLKIVNSGGTGAGVWTITTNTNWTLNGTVIIPPGTEQNYYVTFTSSSAATLQNVGVNPILVQQTYSTNNSTSSSTTLSTADVSGGSVEKILNMTGVITAASNAQLPSATSLFSALPNAQVGKTYKLRIINGAGTGLGVWTITQSSGGWTLTGNLVIPPNTWQDYCVTFTASTTATLQAISIVPILSQQAYTTNSATTATTVTLSAADIFGGSVEHTLNMTGAITTVRNAQLPSVTALVAAMPNAQIGQTYKLRIINGAGSASGVWTVTQSSGGWTLNGAMTIPISLGYRDFYVTLTSLSAGTLQSLGTGTIGAV